MPRKVEPTRKYFKTLQKVKELTEAEVARALQRQGSSPAFLIEELDYPESLNPIHEGDEVIYNYEIYIVVESPDGEEENKSAQDGDLVTLRKAGDLSWTSLVARREELR